MLPIKKLQALGFCTEDRYNMMIVDLKHTLDSFFNVLGSTPSKDDDTEVHNLIGYILAEYFIRSKK